jgi:hypothetical protein
MLLNWAVLDRVKMFLPQIEKVLQCFTFPLRFVSRPLILLSNGILTNQQANKELEAEIQKNGAKNVQIDSCLDVTHSGISEDHKVVAAVSL